MDSNLKAALLISALVLLAILCVVCVAVIGYDGSPSVLAHNNLQSNALLY